MPPLARRLSLLLAVAALLFSAAPAIADARPVIGVGEQSARIFSDANWAALGLPRVRVIVGWDALHVRWQREEIDAYLRAAQARGAKVLLGFGRSREEKRRKKLPTVARMRKEFAAWRARYPGVTEFIAWNEANHCSQPTCRRPEMAARYYNALRSECPECTIVAASVLDTSSMPTWVRRFQRVATGSDRSLVWGLHNYIDANRFRTSGTRALLRATKGSVWFTETGGLVYRRDGQHKIPFPESTAHAAKATRWVLQRLVPLSGRIRRVYFYHWLPAAPGSAWDSALVDRRGRPRPAYKILHSYVRARR